MLCFRVWICARCRSCHVMWHVRGGGELGQLYKSVLEVRVMGDRESVRFERLGDERTVCARQYFMPNPRCGILNAPTAEGCPDWEQQIPGHTVSSSLRWHAHYPDSTYDFNYCKWRGLEWRAAVLVAVKSMWRPSLPNWRLGGIKRVVP